MRGINLHRVGQAEKLLVQRIVEQSCELLRGVGGRQIGPAYVANEQCVSRQRSPGFMRFFFVGDDHADALWSVPWGRENTKEQFPNA